MADMNREEVDAKIGASEARTDSKFATVIARFDALTAEVREMKAEMRNIKMTVILTGISTALAIIFGVAGFNASLLNNMLASFDSGKEKGLWQSEVKTRAEEAAKLSAETRLLIEESSKNNQETRVLLEQLKQERESGRR